MFDSQVLADIPCFCLGVVLLGTGYRLGSLTARVQLAQQSRHSGAKAKPDAGGAPQAANDELVNSLDFRVHGAIVTEFIDLLLDAPCIACAILCLALPWRAAFLLRDLSAAADDSIWRRRRLPFMHLIVALLDVPCVALLALVLATGYRTRRCLLKIRGVSQPPAQDADAAASYRVTGWQMSFGPDVHVVIVRQALGILFDAPFILLAAIVAVSWRSCLMYRDMAFGRGGRVRQRGAAAAGAVDSDGDRPIGESMAAHRRIVACVHFALLFADMPTFVLAALLAVTYYRLPSCLRDVQIARDNRVARRVAREESDPLSAGNAPSDPSFGLEVHAAVWRQGLMLLVDLPFLLMAAIVFCTGWRAFFLWIDLGIGALWLHNCALRFSLQARTSDLRGTRTRRRAIGAQLRGNTSSCFRSTCWASRVSCCCS